MTRPTEWAERLIGLTTLLGLRPGRPAHAETTPPGRAIGVFRNRHDELRKVQTGVTNAGGPHFWLLNSPPELGKTWFLSRLSADVSIAEPDQWVTSLVDLRELVRGNTQRRGEILALMLRLPSAPSDETEALRTIAIDISEAGKSYLCMLDSAELLRDDTVSALRSKVSRIYDLVQRAGNINVRMAFIVASRRDDKWRGVHPSPRLEPLSLTQFSVNVVVDALVGMARQMGRTFDQASFWDHGRLAYQLSEGLPALLVRCLQWIRQEQWIELDRLSEPVIFTELAGPYIQQKLLSADSLLPDAEEIPGEAPGAVVMALRALVPYRLFTQSHLRQYWETDPDFQRILEYLDWRLEDLWAVISRTALLKRPLDELWQEFHDAIRRLLYRHFYTTADDQIDAHRLARKFIEVWADRQRGREQAVGLVECLWHESELLRLMHSSETTEVLSATARTLVRAIQPSTAYTRREVQEYAAKRIREDEDIQESIKDIDGLMDVLTDIILPAEEAEDG